jgi:IclR family acetate operon transcriptional repressor
MGGANQKHTVPAVNKALELVRVLADEDVEATMAGLAERLAIPRTTCYRILRSLAARDWVRVVNGGRYEISLGLFPVLRPLRRYEQLVEAVQPALDALARRSRLTTKISVRQGDYAVTMARCESPMETSVAIRLGATFHLAFGSSGAVLLSSLPREEVSRILRRAPVECWAHQEPADVLRRIEQLRAKRYCADFGTFRPTCHAISAAVIHPPGAVLLAITAIGFPNELTPTHVPALGRALLQAARAMSNALARLPLPTVVAPEKPLP